LQYICSFNCGKEKTYVTMTSLLKFRVETNSTTFGYSLHVDGRTGSFARLLSSVPCFVSTDKCTEASVLLEKQIENGLSTTATEIAQFRNKLKQLSAVNLPPKPTASELKRIGLRLWNTAVLLANKDAPLEISVQCSHFYKFGLIVE
jgi:hypothetical protein